MDFKKGKSNNVDANAAFRSKTKRDVLVLGDSASNPAPSKTCQAIFVFCKHRVFLVFLTYNILSLNVMIIKASHDFSFSVKYDSGIEKI